MSVTQQFTAKKISELANASTPLSGTELFAIEQGGVARKLTMDVLQALVESVDWSDISGKPTFATVATSGSYNDLSNKPTIPTDLWEQGVDANDAPVEGAIKAKDFTSGGITYTNTASGISSLAFGANNNVTSNYSVGASPFDTCRSLKTALYPNTVTSLGSQAFYNLYSLCSIKIPSSVTSMGGNGFGNCYSLRSITVPPNVTQIYGNAFGNCNGVAEYHILPTTPPSLASTTAFSGILDDCKIYVPSASLTAYQEATNWSTYASYMVGE